MEFTLSTVALARTPFREKFGIPRQAGLVPVRGRIDMLPPWDQPEALNGLEQVSHIWLDFIFHQNPSKPEQLSVRPPRLGGNRRLGVFATRASFRPNRLGTSLVKLEAVCVEAGNVHLEVSGIDLLDGTPIVDIKPYLPYADRIDDAVNAIAPAAPAPTLAVDWQAQALLACRACLRELGYVGGLSGDGLCEIEQQVTQLVALDPRPAYKQSACGTYAMSVFGLNVRWVMQTPTQASISDASLA
ncbi:tRNA (adenine(37)-N6)-methyltransferase [BD1-7 clade bacterium]|uniref:tRNA (Adenine(37)-N6)-methyltransferase n=1 Tax=BD1-7 clade bacterium TaxID=2029982 RepID=A0A5S9Q3T9_9GAMM|nr:tRNA (adenine(37)-N6)-methyltransferase [BD1-7 clade bacterium]CAA0111941.1 tRNA (adenine(37)-N6)-methyltransferase [BD1-7 clade bacterium]